MGGGADHILFRALAQLSSLTYVGAQTQSAWAGTILFATNCAFDLKDVDAVDGETAARPKAKPPPSTTPATRTADVADTATLALLVSLDINFFGAAASAVDAAMRVFAIPWSLSFAMLSVSGVDVLSGRRRADGRRPQLPRFT